VARTQGHGNPKWSRDETILALQLYFDCGQTIPSAHDPRVVGLSGILRALPFHSSASKRESFRNADGVAFKLQNLRQVATGRGLGNVSETDRRVWAEFGQHPTKLKRTAELIFHGSRVAQQPLDEDEEEFAEGRTLTLIHKTKERNRLLRKRLLRMRKASGPLCCEMCNRRSATDHPDIADATFEAHHLIPVALSNERKTRIEDMALLCASCHRLVHRAISVSRRWLDIAGTREFLSMN